MQEDFGYTFDFNTQKETYPDAVAVHNTSIARGLLSLGYVIVDLKKQMVRNQPTGRIVYYFKNERNIKDEIHKVHKYLQTLRKETESNAYNSNP